MIFFNEIGKSPIYTRAELKTADLRPGLGSADSVGDQQLLIYYIIAHVGMNIIHGTRHNMYNEALEILELILFKQLYFLKFRIIFQEIAQIQNHKTYGCQYFT